MYFKNYGEGGVTLVKRFVITGNAGKVESKGNLKTDVAVKEHDWVENEQQWQQILMLQDHLIGISNRTHFEKKYH